ncbi:MAG: hypothetical protein ACKODM_15745 [Cytophagales bacterium]
MKLLKSLYITNRFFSACIGLVLLFVVFFILDLAPSPLKILFYLFLAIVFTDALLLFRTRKGMD